MTRNFQPIRNPALNLFLEMQEKRQQAATLQEFKELLNLAAAFMRTHQITEFDDEYCRLFRAELQARAQRPMDVPFQALD